MKLISLILAFSLAYMAGCASSPEAKLRQGYQAASAVVVSTTVLVNRDAISVPEAERVHSMGTTAKQTLDAGKLALTACKAVKTSCAGAVANINLGSGVLLELESYLKAREAK